MFTLWIDLYLGRNGLKIMSRCGSASHHLNIDRVFVNRTSPLFFRFFVSTLSFFFLPPQNKYKVFHGIANHRFSDTQKKQTTVLFISGGRAKVRTEPEPFLQSM